MIKIVTAVEKYEVKPGDVCMFLAGTIDNSDSFDWQAELLDWLKDYKTEKNVIVFNPRRKEWNKNAGKEELDEQIEWELEALSRCDYIIMNILGTSKSPITLLELGLFHRNPGLYVFCPPEFYRYENVRVSCKKFGVKHFDDNSTENIKKLLNLLI